MEKNLGTSLAFARVTLPDSQGTSYACIPLHNLSFLHDMMFKLDFKALYFYFVQREISCLKKYIPGSQTALPLVSCKNIL